MNHELEQTKQQFVKVMRSCLATVLLMGAWLVFDSRPGGQLAFAAPCDTPLLNPIVCENSKPGNPASEWDISGAGSSSIQGFATDISVNQGETVHFKVDTDASAYRLDIYRMGYYGGMGARKVATVRPSVPLPQNQPNCLTDGATGLIDCGNWAESASWAVPPDATSGIYFAKLVRESGVSGASHIVFIVRNDVDPNEVGSDLLFQTSDTTWQAYNNYGGNSLYAGSPAGRAYKVSYNRPFNTRSNGPEDWVFNAEYPMVRWLEANGYDVSYFTGVDSDRRGTQILKHQAFLSVGHDEYWSGGQRANVEAARNAGVHLAFFSGNEVFWKTRWESSIDGSGTDYRTLVCYKETHANAKIDPLPNVWTGTWRDPRFSPPADGGRPENALTGTIFKVNSGTSAIKVPAADGEMRFWRNTSIATLASGQTATLPSGTLGYEWDEELDNGVRPAGLVRLSTTAVSGVEVLLDYGSTYGSGTATHRLTLYRHSSSGALVFGAGTVQWSWGLDSHHDRGSAAPDVRMQQAMVNLFADMGVQPDTLQSGLVTATASTDNAHPISTITSPAAGSTVQSGSPITISGTATDAGGGVVGGVEVSVDGGTTWHPANGRASWSYTWAPSALGSVTIMSRAVDDSGNLEPSPATVTVSVEPRACPCSLWSNATVPAVAADSDNQAVEVGVKFQAQVDGFISGLRFYKGSGNTGTHVGTLWTATGAPLAQITFAGETASGWQQANFSSAVRITANSTYVASYHTNTGHYAVDEGYFGTTFTTPPLSALATSQAGGNGVYRYSSTSTFPTETFNASNYWVDVVFTTSGSSDTTPPTISTVSQPDGTTNVDPGANVTATFSEAMDPTTINTNTVQLRDSAGNLVPASITYNAATNTVTLDPTASLASSTTYRVTIKSGTNGVKDAAGNQLSADVTWSFTTAASSSPICPCSLWSNATVPAVAADPDNQAIEVGVKFQAQAAGFITGLRFYKSTTNTGTHVGTLWTATGTLLTSVTFTGETASGWQQVSFASPVAIAANTTYVASYHTNTGHYAVNEGYFATAFTNGPLQALASSTPGGNGVYVYGASAFPTQTFNASNYWVDVVFTTQVPPHFTDTTVADFGAGTPNGTPGANTYIGQTADGEVLLLPTVGTEFTGTTLPAGWTAPAWSTGGTATVANGVLTLDGARAGQVAPYGPGRSLEFVATFSGAANQNVGFTNTTTPDFSTAPWAMFTTRGGGNLYAQTRLGSTTNNTTLGSGRLGAPHRFRIDWNASNVVYSVDGTVVATHNRAISQNMSPLASDRTVGGGSVVVDWLRLSPYATSGIFTSRVFDAGAQVSWGTASWTSQLPSGTSLSISVRLGNTLPLTGSWIPLSGSGATIVGSSQYIQYQARLASTVPGQTPVLHDLTINEAAGGTMTGASSFSSTAVADTFAPSGSLAQMGTLATTLKGGADGVQDPSGNTLTANTLSADGPSSLAAAAPSAASAPDQGPGGPILVVAGASNPFSRYYAEILRTEGFNAFDVSDISAVSTPTLAAYDVVILGPLSLTPAQVTMFSDWVNAGGKLIAMRPDKQLASLLGLTDTSSILANAYLLVDTSTGPGAGIVSQTIQYRGIADRYTLSGASRLATLYSNASTATANPAVTLRSVGTNGGQAAAFTYDLALSVVDMRQGNTDWAGQERDGFPPRRSDDMFFGNASGDPQPDWVDLNKVAIPQADEQQRLLANLILSMNRDKKPLPRFWYFPHGKKAVVIMTGDDHANGGTAGRFDQYKANSPAGCLVADWECIRSTSYIYPTTPLTDAQAASYVAQGFEVGLHVTTGCDNWTTPSSLESFYSDQLATFASTFPSVPAPTTNRTHCIVWSDYMTQPQVELAHGIRLDTNYYYWPPSWLADRPGFFTGSGMPMRFALLDGTMIDIYQATTQMTDESGQTYPFTINALLDKAIGTEGYYGAFTANMHTDSVSSSGSDAIIASAQARGVPVVSARQMLTWLDGRDSSSFGSLAWNGNTLSFTITPGSGTNGIQAMLPTTVAAGALTGITRNGASVSYSTQVVKGIDYAFFAATVGTYQATYAPDTTPPTVGSTSVPNGATNVDPAASFTITFSEAMDPATINTSTIELRDANGTLVPVTVTYNAATHTATVNPIDTLAFGTTYTMTITGAKDQAGNALANVTSSFTTTPLACPCSLWSNATTPTVASANDPNAVELGVKFQSTVNGFITGLRFYKGASNTGTHVGNLWTSSGTLLASATFTNETASGWQQVTLSAPVAITTNTTYVASYHTTAGNYAFDGAYFASSGVSNPPLRALANGEEGGNGLFVYGASAFPSQTFNSSNYWVDVVFTTQAPPSNNPVPTTSGLAPNSAIAGGAAFTLTVNGTNFVTNSVVRWNEANRPTTFVSATQLTAAIAAADIAATGTAAVTVFNPAPGGGTSNTQTFTISASAACPCSLWSDATVPAVAADNDAKRVEVGVKFQAQSDGYITGLRFYKGTTNTGVHVGTLWTAAGIPLTSVTFSGETASGWQQASFASPVPIKAGIIYVASYHTDTGHYALNEPYFGTAFTNGPLRALADGEAGGNGVYIYSASSAFPTQTFNASNYWVDVVFTPSLPPGTFLDTTVVDFRTGTPEAGTYIGQTADGEVLLAPTIRTEFDGTALPSGWTAFSGTATVANGMLTIDGARAGTTATFGAGRSLEFVATFSGAANQNVGFGTDFSIAPWARFTTQGGNLLAQTRFGSTTTSTPLGSGRLGAPHRFRIDWNATNVVYSVDGTVVATHARASTTPMRPLVSDATAGGGTVVVDWLRMTPYATSGIFTSQVFNAGALVSWGTASWTSTVPSGTSLRISVRQGTTPIPDGTWTPFTPLSSSGATIGGSTRYIQYQAQLITTIPGQTPVLHNLTLTYNPGAM